MIVFPSWNWIFKVLLNSSKKPVMMPRLIIYKHKEIFLPSAYTTISSSLSSNILQADTKI